MKTEAKMTKMTAAEIKEAIKRDKEWMDNLDPDEEIVIDKKTLKEILGNDDDSGEDDAEASTSGMGGIFGAIAGGVLGGILGTSLFDD